jgi:hypothetical protein
MCASAWIDDNASFAAGQSRGGSIRHLLTKKANTGSEDGNRIAKHNCATSANLGHKKEPAFRIDVPKHAAKGG